MKKNFQINIAYTLFNIDEDAYEVLSNYFEKLHVVFKSESGAKEIFHDIEMRVSELLQSRLSESKRVIVIADVQYVISEMGEVEDIANDISDDGSENQNEDQKNPRRLFRDGDNKIVGGVASGIAAFFDIDSTWVRVAFVLLTILGCFGLIIYLMLYLLVPEARTASDRLKMKGEKVTAENIAQNIENEFNNVKNNIKSLSKKKTIFTKIVTLIWKTLACAFALLSIVCCVYFLIAIFLLLFTNITLGAVSMIPFDHLSFPQMMFAVCINDFWSVATIACFSVLLIIPCFHLLVFAVCILLKIKARNKFFNRVSSILWVVSLIFVLISVCIHTWFYSNFDVQKIEKNIPKTENVLNVDINSVGDSLNFDNCSRYHDLLACSSAERYKLYSLPRVEFHENDSTFKIVAKIYRRGNHEVFENMPSVYSVGNDSVDLLCLPYITSDKCFTWVSYHIYLPENTILHLSDNTKYVFNAIHIISDTEMSGDNFIFKNGELRNIADSLKFYQPIVK